MGVFGRIFRGTKYLLKSSLYLGGLYTFAAYFYVKEINYRLGDTEESARINEETMRSMMENVEGEKDID